jgi:hypothetical protein
MKKLLLSVLLVLTIQFTHSQQKNPRGTQFDLVPEKIIVKLKDVVQAKVQCYIIMFDCIALYRENSSYPEMKIRKQEIYIL